MDRLQSMMVGCAEVVHAMTGDEVRYSVHRVNGTIELRVWTHEMTWGLRGAIGDEYLTAHALLRALIVQAAHELRVRDPETNKIVRGCELHLDDPAT